MRRPYIYFVGAFVCARAYVPPARRTKILLDTSDTNAIRQGVELGVMNGATLTLVTGPCFKQGFFANLTAGEGTY